LGESELLLEGEDSLITASQSFIFSRSIVDKKWVEEIFIQSKSWCEDKKVNFLLGLPFGEDTFKILSQLDGNIDAKYWKKIKRYNLADKDIGKINWVLEKLLLYERPLAALDVASCVSYSSSPKVLLDCRLLADILQKIAFSPLGYKIKNTNQIQHRIYKTIEYIQEQKQLSEEEIRQIEWIYLPMLRFCSIKSKYLEKEILNNPEFFSQIVSFVFKGEKDKEDTDERLKQLRAKNALILLNLISKIPGQKEDCTVDAEKLREWVYKARAYLETMGRIEIGDYQIGKVLSNSPLGTDKIWPHESVRDLIEELQNPDIEEGLEVEKKNSREATTRFIFDGGKQERELTAKYDEQVKMIMLKWPRTSEILRSLKRAYELDASWHDSRADLIN
jgi:hypothetical protein